MEWKPQPEAAPTTNRWLSVPTGLLDEWHRVHHSLKPSVFTPPILQSFAALDEALEPEKVPCVVPSWRSAV